MANKSQSSASTSAISAANSQSMTAMPDEPGGSHTGEVGAHPARVKAHDDTGTATVQATL